MELFLNKVVFSEAFKFAINHLPDNSIDLIVADPDYGKGKVAKKFDGIPDINIINQFNRVLKPTGNIIMFGVNIFTAKMILLNEEYYRYSMVWEKNTITQFLNAKSRPLPSHEDIMIFNKGNLATYNPEMVKGQKAHSAGKNNIGKSNGGELYGKTQRVERTTDMKYPRTVLKYNMVPPTLRLYPTQKPVDMLRYMVRTFSNPGEIVWDPFCGSGSTGEAAHLENRKFILTDKSVEAISISKERIKGITMW